MKAQAIVAAVLLLLVPGLSLAAGPISADETGERRLGICAAISAVPLVAGDSGPETPLSATKYNDTFDSGFGLRLELFRDWNPSLRLCLGGVWNGWNGKSFTGGEFPGGAEFGDFYIAGLYAGGRIAFFRGSRLRPYILGNLGVVYMPSVDVTTGGKKIPYWGEFLRDFLELGAGAEYSLSDRAFVFADVRFTAFGAPRGQNYPISEATGGQCVPISLGLGFRF